MKNHLKKITGADILNKNIPPGRLIAMLVLPTFIQELMAILVNYVDTAMVGRLGPNATASTALGMPIMMMTNGIIIGLALGYSVLVGRKIGQGDKNGALHVMRQAFYLIIVFGVLLNLLYAFVLAPHLPKWLGAERQIWGSSSAYLFHIGWSRIVVVALFVANNLHNSQGDTKITMIAMVSSNIVNCVLNFFMIYKTRAITVFGFGFICPGWGKGVAGAAIATSISNFVAAGYSVYKLFDKKKEVPLSFGGFSRFDNALAKNVIRIGLPMAAERAVISLGQLTITGTLANMGTKFLAAHNLATHAESICFLSVMGFMTASTTLVAQWLGHKDEEYAQLLAGKCIKYSIVIMAVASAFLYITAPVIISIFTPDKYVVKIAAEALRIQCTAEVFSAVAMTISGVLRGAGDVRYGAVVSILGMWAVRIPLILLCIRRFELGLNGVWIPMAIDWVFRCTAMLLRYKSGKWKGAFQKHMM